MKTAIVILFFLGNFYLFGQKTSGVLKIDFDTTIIYVDLGVVFELSGNEIPDSIFHLWTLNDTTISKDLKRLICNNKVYNFDISKALVKILRKNDGDIYYKGIKIEEYKIERKYKRKKHEYYYYTDIKTNKRFLVLTIFQQHSTEGDPAF
jgi:hypothetical protein